MKKNKNDFINEMIKDLEKAEELYSQNKDLFLVEPKEILKILFGIKKPMQEVENENIK